MIWGPLLLAAGMVVMVRRGRARVLLYLGGPLLLAFGAACLHRYPFMAHYGGNRLMLFSAPVLYLLVAAGGWGVFALALAPAPAVAGPGPDRAAPGGP